MARIQTISGTAVPNSPLGIKADAGRAAAGDYANMQLAGAAQQTARVLEGISMQRQAYIDRGKLSSENNIRNKTAAEVQTYMDDHQGTPEAWGDFHKQTWKAYEDGRATRSKDWSPRLKQEDDIQLEQFRTVSGINFDTKQNTALIRKSTAQQKADAETRLDNSDVRGALEIVGKMNVTPEKRIELIDQLTDGAVKRQYVSRFEGIQQLAPVQRIEELNQIHRELTERSKTGEYDGGKIIDEQTGQVIGGASEGTRLDLIRASRQIYEGAIVDMNHVGTKILHSKNPEADLKAANEAGLVSDEIAATLVPEIKAKLDAKTAALGTKRDKAATQVESMINRRGGATITAQEIETRMALGAARPDDPMGLTPEDGNKLKAELLAVQEADWALLREGKTIDSELNAIAGNWFLPTWFGDDSQISPSKQQELLQRISEAKVSKGVKHELLKKFFTTQRTDLGEMEIEDREGDRDISAEEKQLRLKMIGKYSESVTDLGTRGTGGLYLSAMDKISQWYRKNPNATPAMRQQASEQLEKDLSRQMNDEAGRSLISGSTIYGNE